MQTVAEVVGAPVRSRGRLSFGLGACVLGSLLVAGLAQISIRLPFTPVPITGQTLGVLLVGASLGSGLGALSLLLYLAEGAVGLPFFAGGYSGAKVLVLSSPTGGYLWGFVVAASLVGGLSRLGWDRSFRSSIGAMFLGEVGLYAIGIPWLMGALNVSLQRALELGLYPFVVGDTLKVLVAAGLLPGAWWLLGRETPRA
jgi:biotin transport system substrate-specific component